MEVNTAHPKQNVLVNPVSLSGQKKTARPESEADKSEPVTDDAVLLSKESLKLSQSSALQGGVNPPPIENGDQAQKAADHVAADIKNNPGRAQLAYGNYVQFNLKSLLG